MGKETKKGIPRDVVNHLHKVLNAAGLPPGKDRQGAFRKLCQAYKSANKLRERMIGEQDGKTS